MSNAIYQWTPSAIELLEAVDGGHDHIAAQNLPAGYWVERVLVWYELTAIVEATVLSPLPKWRPMTIAAYLRQGVDNDVPLSLPSGNNDFIGQQMIQWQVDAAFPDSAGFTYNYHAPRGDGMLDAKGVRTIRPENDGNNTLWVSLGVGSPDTPSDKWVERTFDMALLVYALIGHNA